MTNRFKFQILRFLDWIVRKISKEYAIFNTYGLDRFIWVDEVEIKPAFYGSIGDLHMLIGIRYMKISNPFGYRVDRAIGMMSFEGLEHNYKEWLKWKMVSRVEVRKVL